MSPAAAAPRSALRGIAVAQAGIAAVLAFRPDDANRLAGQDPHDAPPTWIVRVLGVRQLVQAAVQFARPTPGVALTAAAVDASHSASMVWLALRTDRYRRAAVLSGGLAAASAVSLAVAGAAGARLR